MAAGYYLLARLGVLLGVPPSNFAILWPATPFLTGCLLLTAPRWWWTYALAVIGAHALMLAGTSVAQVPLAVAATQVGGNLLLAALTAAAVLRLGGGRPRLGDFRGVLAFVAVAGLAIPALVNALILAVHLATGWASDFWLSWRQWMLASIFPTVTLVPLMVLARDRPAWDDGRRPSAAEVTVLSALLVALAWIAFGAQAVAEVRPALALAPLPILIWAAALWGVEGAAFTLLLFAGTIIACALADRGPFAVRSPTDTVLGLQVYLTAIAVPLVLFAALMQDRRRNAQRLAHSEARVQLIAAATDTGLWQWDAEPNHMWMTDHCRAMFALPPGDDFTPEVFVDAIHPQDQPRARAALRQAMARDGVSALDPVRVPREDEAPRWYSFAVHSELDAHGRPSRVSGLFRDITPQRQAQEQADELTRRILTLQEDERRNIAEALHDTAGQHLVGAVMALSMVERRIDPGPQLRPLVEDVRTGINKAIGELRALTYILTLPELEAEGLRAVLRRYAKGFELRTGIRTRARLTAEADRLPLDHQRTLLRIAQEALANVYRHAAATSVALDLRAVGGGLHLVVRDDGRGLAPPGARPQGEVIRAGVGIPGMAARIRQLGGKFDIRFTDKGTTVHVALPLPAAMEDGGDEHPSPELSSRF